jgi:voltage-gated potassium channel
MIRKSTLWIDIATVILALISVGLLVFELSADLLAEQIILIQRIDLGISLVFLTDFIYGLYRAPSRKAYLKHHWPDLIASIPISSEIFRSARALRLIRLVRVIRVIARIRHIGIVADKVLDERGNYIYAAVVTAVIILSGAVAFFSMEFGINPNVNHFFDAIWWAVTTTTTVGYGDIIPFTTAGRLIGMILMFLGMGIVGGIAGVVGSRLMSKRHYGHHLDTDKSSTDQ